ncbi:flagella basal body P-ring formation protein FlgA [Halomonas campaniensis]|uniref:Flagella basal body P-ring formation protein FlgA n=1 Tax=Halomonas campaniensis TaxID=213554 RepID=A0A7W5P9T8_9GAMM|nr:flagellar basal body P-ring formation chaperone FlgA [Halomonas campaniensis]MBB3329902.1 flagella basal body P-ring formation protein FlgA [Halomonas campaniensis]
MPQACRQTRTPNRLPRLLMAAALLLASMASSADEAMLAEVHAFLYDEANRLGDEVVIEVRPPSAHLPACNSPQPFLPHAGQPVMGRVSVGVRCGEQGRQVRYLQAEVGVIGDYPVAARDMAAGTLVTADLLETRRGNLSRLPRHAILDADELLGQQASRPIRAGETLQAHQFQAPTLVERGQAVVVEAQGPSFRVTREGEALEPGGHGERVRVRFGSRELVTARVVGNGRLVVDF